MTDPVDTDNRKGVFVIIGTSVEIEKLVKNCLSSKFKFIHSFSPLIQNMIRPLAASFACLAVAVTVTRGALESSVVEHTIGQAFVSGISFAIVGGVAGWILDYVIRDHLRVRFESRLRWYRESMDSAGSIDASDVGQISET